MLKSYNTIADRTIAPKNWQWICFYNSNRLMMLYYYIVYTGYPPQKAPEQKEYWLASETHRDDSEVKKLLEEVDNIRVSIVLKKEITAADFDNRSH